MTMKNEVQAILERLGVSVSLTQRGSLSVTTPLTGEEIGQVETGTKESVTEQIDRAHNAYLEWRVVPAPRRGELVRLLGDELRKSKDDLGLAYLRERHSQEFAACKQALAGFKTPLDRYIQFNTIMKETVEKDEYRGCAFLNMAIEVSDPKSPIRKEAKYHYEAVRAVMRDIVEDLIESDPKYRHLDVSFVADQFMTIQVGAITNAKIYQSSWPYEHAGRAIRELIGENH